MLFNSLEFIFLFLPMVYVVFQILHFKGKIISQIVWLTAASLFFYAWWNPSYLLLILLSIGANYAFSLLIVSQRAKNHHRLFLVLGLLFNLCLLGYFKYANFFVDNINYLLTDDFHLQKIILPLAISFFTFQQIAYLVDTYKGLTEPHSFLEYCLFVTFFPQLIAGPIVHHKQMLPQFQTLHLKKEVILNLAIGCSIISIGLFKKVILADSFAQWASPAYSAAADGADINTLDALAGIFSYSFQLYFDFSGYSDMAIGLAFLFGVRLPVNFFSPYRAQNIADFWRMWHATLARFLRDYIYTPLGGFVCSPRRQKFNLFATMFLGGVWHGAGWTFVIYGSCHGLYVVLHQIWRIKISGPLGLINNRIYKYSCQAFTFVLISLTLVFFRAESLESATYLFKSLMNFPAKASQ
ncbi:MBOAT family protein [Oceanicoccus sp. KOV_DT_Chl]|uniref:MBOAT family O-acyltransferase n=1 Tax=Oceanicoccus sp. KOV_DT_Chl TaxID=1904639 RepID=UPI001F1DC781|nr:MBOAT family O-acyltransferase [Oceanicoccus sp. KOV_DT_Chl]